MVRRIFLIFLFMQDPSFLYLSVVKACAIFCFLLPVVKSHPHFAGLARVPGAARQFFIYPAGRLRRAALCPP